MKEFWCVRLLLVMLSFALSDYAFAKEDKDLLRSLSKKEGGANTLYIENKGQIGDQHGKPNASVKYLILRPGLNIQLKANSFSYDAYTIERFKRVERLVEPLQSKFDKQNDDSLVYQFSRVDIELVDANPNPEITQEGSSSDYLNYYTHITSQTHGEEGVTGIKGYSTITYHDMYPNIDLEWFLDKDGKPEYQFIINPGGDPSRIRLKYYGAQKTELISDAIHIHIKPGIIKEHIPLSYLKESKEKLHIAFTKISNDEYGFNIPIYASNETLIIDPMPNRLWGTYYGGSGFEGAYLNQGFVSVSTDASENVYLAGATSSGTDIASAGAYDVTKGSYFDAFLVKFSSSGSRIWGTYYGGISDDYGGALAIDASGNVYIAGSTQSISDIASTGAWDETYGGGTIDYGDAFLVKFSSSGSRIWGTYYGGTGSEVGKALAIDASGNVYFTGWTSSTTDIASAGAWDVTSSKSNAFLVKFSSTGSRIWGTYYGGNSSYANALAIDTSGNLYLGGETYSTTDIASTGAYDVIFGEGPQAGSQTDAFLVKFSSSGSRIWGTYYGGSNYDVGNAVAIDALGNVYLGGFTGSSSSIASTGAWDDTYAGGQYDAFLVKFSSTGSRIWGTYYGGSDGDYGRGIATVASGDVYLVGYTQSTTNIASTGAYDVICSHGVNYQDAFLVKFSSTGSRIWGTYYGGGVDERGIGIATDALGDVYLVGETKSTEDIVSTGAYDVTLGGTSDAFLVKFEGNENQINSPILSSSSFCQNESFTLSYTTTGTFTSPNTFTAQLSNANGLFTNPTPIGLINSTTSGTINCRIPNETPVGFNYRIRIISSDTNVISQVNANDITVNLLPNPIISGPQNPCSGIQIYGVPFVPGHIYNWQKPDRGQIVGSNSGNTLKVRWINVGSDSLKVSETNSLTGCMKDTVIFITINSNPSIAINGAIKVCNSLKSERYFVDVEPEMSCKWNSPLKGSILGNDKNKFVDIVWSIPGIDTLKLKITSLKTGCSSDTFIVVSVIPKPIPIINGNSEVLEQDKGLEYSVQSENGSTYEWVIVSGDATITTKSGQLVVVNVGSKGAVILKVIQTNKDGCTNEAQFVINVKSVSGIKESTQSAFSIYPNPTGDANQIILQFSEAQKQQIDVELLDILGNQMYRSSLSVGDQSTTIPVHNLCSGMYMIRVHMNNEVYIEKVIVN
jgi:hypothetical protein